MPYLIVGGTTKAATTSLFQYLAEHPHVCAASIKETRFFLDADYPLESKYRFEDGLERYDEFFRDCPGTSRLRVEATPDYLYSQGTARRIAESLPEARLLFVFREPVSRLISWYRFAQQRKLLPPQVTWDEYVRQQLEGGDGGEAAQPMRALEQGRYSLYLKPYLRIFGRDRVYVTFLDELARDPRSVLEAICTFAGIEPSFYTAFDFQVFNRTDDMRSSGLHRAYIRLKFQLQKQTLNKPRIRRLLKQVRRAFEPLYLWLNTQGTSQQILLSPEIASALESYYDGEAEALAELTGRPVPWQSFSASLPRARIQQEVLR
jgi:hypothetical protein